MRRLTNPMEPAAVINLYHEFHRMSRLWRWMKKLKWAGYGHNGKDPLNVAPGDLANFCPACPQPKINLPADWKDNVNRYVKLQRIRIPLATIFGRSVYKVMLVADGNFKADHVQQKNNDRCLAV